MMHLYFFKNGKNTSNNFVILLLDTNYEKKNEG